MRLHAQDYREKILGCWLGKNVGGTLGAPFEWRRQVNNVSFYTQDLKGEPMPNDDLDIQLLWLCALEEKGLDINARTLAEYWCIYVTPHWSEYGTAKVNMRSGLLPPLCGWHRNAFRHSCGSYIRSEIWACIAPGLPHIAARYAYEDAILDHGNGEGVYAEVFMACMESAAFVVNDLKSAIAVGLSYVPEDCGVAKAVQTALRCHAEGKSWREARDEILRHHRGSTFLNWRHHTSEEDQAKGFHEGILGYDVPSNIGMTLIGLLYGGDDFGQVQCIAVNCGEDTDCTAATAGSVWGIMHGASAIPKRWLEPIGRGIKTVSLNLGELGYFGNQLPQTVDELTERTARLAWQMLARHNALHLMSDQPTDLNDVRPEALCSPDRGASLYACLCGPRLDFDFFSVRCDYGDGPVIRQGQPKEMRFIIENRYKVQANLSLHWYLPDGWTVSPSQDGWALSLPRHLGPSLELLYYLRSDRLQRPINRAVLEITAEGRPLVMLVPVILLAEVATCV